MWSTPEDRAAAASMASQQEHLSRTYPARAVNGHLLHVFEEHGEWDVWLNTEDIEFSGLCIGTGKTYDEAVGQAVRTLEACAEALQGPRWFEET